MKTSDFIYLLFFLLIAISLVHGMQQRIARIVPEIRPVLAAPPLPTKTPVTPTPKTVIKYVPVQSDNRAGRLELYLKAKKSPLAPYSAYIIQESDKNAVDWTLLVAISRMESGYGSNTKQECHNPFGYGGRRLVCFKSWQEAISAEAQLLGEDYRENTTAAIQEKYCPAIECNPAWSDTVISTTRDILAER